MKFTHKLFMLALSVASCVQLNAGWFTNDVRTVRGKDTNKNLILEAKSLAEVDMVVATLSSKDQEDTFVKDDVEARKKAIQADIDALPTAKALVAAKKALSENKSTDKDVVAKLNKDVADTQKAFDLDAKRIELVGKYPMHKKAYNTVFSKTGLKAVVGLGAGVVAYKGYQRYATTINPFVKSCFGAVKAGYSKVAAPLVNKVVEKALNNKKTTAGIGIAGLGVYGVCKLRKAIKSYPGWKF